MNEHEAELQADAGGVAVGLPMPDGPGHWAIEARLVYKKRHIEYQGMVYIMPDDVHCKRVRIDGKMIDMSDIIRGTWTRIYMPWEQAQPAPVVAVPAPDWLQAFPPEWDRHPWANYAYLQPSYSHFDGITFKWYYFECEPTWGEKSYNWVDGTHGYQNPVTRAPLSAFFDVRQTLQARPQPPQEQGAR